MVQKPDLAAVSTQTLQLMQIGMARKIANRLTNWNLRQGPCCLRPAPEWRKNIRMSHPHPKGLWVRVHDRESALYTVRGSGFPLFLIGFTAAIAALMIAGPDTALRAALIGLLAVALMALGYAIRAGIGHPALIPVAWVGFIALIAAEWGQTASALILAQVLISLVAASGVRGWLWLRKH